jgi:hypothetical protein
MERTAGKLGSRRAALGFTVTGQPRGLKDGGEPLFQDPSIYREQNVK